MVFRAVDPGSLTTTVPEFVAAMTTEEMFTMILAKLEETNAQLHTLAELSMPPPTPIPFAVNDDREDEVEVSTSSKPATASSASPTSSPTSSPPRGDDSAVLIASSDQVVAMHSKCSTSGPNQGVHIPGSVLTSSASLIPSQTSAPQQDVALDFQSGVAEFLITSPTRCSTPGLYQNVSVLLLQKMPKPPWMLGTKVSRSWSGKLELVSGFLLEVSPWCSDYTIWVQWQPAWPPPVSDILISSKEEIEPGIWQTDVTVPLQTLLCWSLLNGCFSIGQWRNGHVQQQQIFSNGPLTNNMELGAPWNPGKSEMVEILLLSIATISDEFPPKPPWPSPECRLAVLQSCVSCPLIWPMRTLLVIMRLSDLPYKHSVSKYLNPHYSTANFVMHASFKYDPSEITMLQFHGAHLRFSSWTMRNAAELPLKLLPCLSSVPLKLKQGNPDFTCCLASMHVDMAEKGQQMLDGIVEFNLPIQQARCVLYACSLGTSNLNPVTCLDIFPTSNEVPFAPHCNGIVSLISSLEPSNILELAVRKDSSYWMYTSLLNIASTASDRYLDGSDATSALKAISKILGLWWFVPWEFTDHEKIFHKVKKRATSVSNQDPHQAHARVELAHGMFNYSLNANWRDLNNYMSEHALWYCWYLGCAFLSDEFLLCKLMNHSDWLHNTNETAESVYLWRSLLQPTRHQIESSISVLEAPWDPGDLNLIDGIAATAWGQAVI